MPSWVRDIVAIAAATLVGLLLSAASAPWSAPAITSEVRPAPASARPHATERDGRQLAADLYTLR